MSWMLESCKWKSREAYIYIYIANEEQPHWAWNSQKHSTCLIKHFSHIWLALHTSMKHASWNELATLGLPSSQPREACTINSHNELAQRIALSLHSHQQKVAWHKKSIGLLQANQEKLYTQDAIEGCHWSKSSKGIPNGKLLQQSHMHVSHSNYCMHTIPLSYFCPKFTKQSFTKERLPNLGLHHVMPEKEHKE